MFVYTRGCLVVRLYHISIWFVIHFEQKSAQRGARTHDPEIKSLMLYRLS